MIDFILYVLLISLVIYFGVMTLYYRSLYQKELNGNKEIKGTLTDAEIVIRRYQIQLQRAIGNIDILNEELAKVKDDIKSVRTKNSQLRMENDKHQTKIKDLESKIDALL